MLQFTNSLDSLMLQKKGKSRCINQENPKGEKGKGGMAAGSLGAGRKGSPCMQKIIPGETRVLAEMEGPGVIQHIWMTVTDRTEKGYIKKDTFSMWFKIIVACVPAAVVELVWGDQLEAAFYHYQVVALMLILVGIVFLIVERWNKGRDAKVTTIAQITYRAAFMIGMFQLIAALFPGTSRSGATIIGGLVIGLSRTVAAEFTFFLAIPVMFGASLMKVMHFGLHFSGYELGMLLLGMFTAFLVSVLVIRFLMDYIRKHDFKPFGWYRIVLGILVLVYFGIGA